MTTAQSHELVVECVELFITLMMMMMMLNGQLTWEHLIYFCSVAKHTFLFRSNTVVLCFIFIFKTNEL